MDKPSENMITSLEQLYFDQIRDLYSAEMQLLGMLPQMAAHATCRELRNAFNDHLQETHTHCARLRIISERHGTPRQTMPCDAMRGLLRQVMKYLTQTVPGDVRDAMLIASGNRIEQYEIAGYGVAKEFAECLGFAEDVCLLNETLAEEAAVDAAITKIATGGLFRRGVNEAASIA